MNAKDALKEIEKHIKGLEQAVYQFDTVMVPRMEKDKEILKDLRDQHGKLTTLIEKEKRKEDITNEEAKEAIPKQFR